MKEVNQLNKKKDGDWIREQNKVYSIDGLAPTINKGNGGNLVPKILIPPHHG